MTLRLPLFTKIMGWFFLNLLLVTVVTALVFKVEFGWKPDWVLLGEAGSRIQSASQIILAELNDHPSTEWNAILQRFSDVYHIKFVLFDNDGPQLAGKPVSLPPEISAKLLERGPERPPAGMADGPPPADPPLSFIQNLEHHRLNMSIEQSRSSPHYWLMIRVPLVDHKNQRLIRASMFAMSDSFDGGGFFFDYKPWLWLVLGAVVFSILFWLPVIASLTRSVLQMKKAAAQIAEGRFEVRVSEKRGDEIGALGGAINRMAARLAGFVTGQKRFMGDVAHELCSPIARMQIAVSILEERTAGIEKKYVDSLREDVAEMSNLVNELLSFSRASLNQGQVRLQPVALRAAVEKAVRREAAENPNVQIEIAEDIHVLADQELLMRAACNLLRNAVRYAGESVITISARALDGQVELSVADQGPGVPESEIHKLFDPFYRVDTSRTRETGGVGLGLSIVKTCIETCRGSVSCRNRKPCGFEVLVQLPGAPPRA